MMDEVDYQNMFPHLWNIVDWMVHETVISKVAQMDSLPVLAEMFQKMTG